MRLKSRVLITLILLVSSIALPAAEKVVLPKTALAIYAPKPTYPFFALMRHEEGSGIFVFRVDIKTGRVRQVIIVQSTGHKDLDSAATKVFKKWKFQASGLQPVDKLPSFINDPSAKKDALVKAPVTFNIR
jgi:TonB family protein